MSCGRADAKPELAGRRKLVGDAEALPFADNSFDRYVSCGGSNTGRTQLGRSPRHTGSWGPAEPSGRGSPIAADTWRAWWPTPGCCSGWRTSTANGSRQRASKRSRSPPAPPWGHRSGEPAYAVAIAGRATRPGRPKAPASAIEDRHGEPWTIRRSDLLRGWLARGCDLRPTASARISAPDASTGTDGRAHRRDMGCGPLRLHGSPLPSRCGASPGRTRLSGRQ